MNKKFHAAFDMPTTADEALAKLERWGDPLVMTFDPKHAKRMYELLAEQLEWHPISTVPVGERVLLWDDEEGEAFFGHKPEDAPNEHDVVTDFPGTAAYADAWRPVGEPRAMEEEDP